MLKRKLFYQCIKENDLIRKVLWEKKLLPRKVSNDGCDVFLSLYQCPTVLKGARHVMLVHDTVWKIFPEYLNNSRKKVYYRKIDKAIKKADHIMTVSENSKKDVMKFYGIQPEKITVNYDDCDPIFKQEYTDEYADEILGNYNLKQGFIFYVGGFDTRKNTGALIEAYAMLWSHYHDSMEIPDLVLGGAFHSHLVPLLTDLPEKISEVRNKYKIPTEKIKHVGFIAQKDLPLFYFGAKFFCYPSLYEGFGLPVLEAMNCGCAVITSKTSSIPEVTGDNAAMLIDPNDPEQIMAAMHTFLHDQEGVQRYIENAKQRTSLFNWSKFLSITYKTLNEVVK